MQLDQLADREATKLSGGQQQRLALARALVMEPQLLLLDEPLSNLDAKLRDRMRFELKRLQRELGMTTIYVTHDQSEALALSHEIAVMNEGRIVQIGTPAPDLRAAAQTSSSPISSARTNFLDGTVAAADDGSGRCVVIPASANSRRTLGEGVQKAPDVVVSVRPEDVELSEDRAARRRPATTSSGPPSAARISSASIWIFTSRWAMLCCWRGRIRRCGRPPATRSIVRMKSEKCVAITE